ncbi:hypothetical protein Pelo_16549 [Pelomyxa schiedti]|nr:hypothetical protein Pelo_16549 [Pelomyxa schiedti]
MILILVFRVKNPVKISLVAQICGPLPLCHVQVCLTFLGSRDLSTSDTVCSTTKATDQDNVPNTKSTSNGRTKKNTRLDHENIGRGVPPVLSFDFDDSFGLCGWLLTETSNTAFQRKWGGNFVFT